MLTTKQEKAITSLLMQPTVARAAEAAGIAERSLYHWLAKDADFQEAYRVARREATSHAIARLQRNSEGAVQVLVNLMARETTNASVRLAAARTVLEMAIKSVEIEDLAARLAALEAKYAEKL